MEELRKIITIIFKAFPLTYLLGYLVIGGYLSNYSFFEYNILNLTFLKAGIFITTFIASIIVMVYFCFTKETMTDDLKKSWPSYLLAFFLVNLFVFAISNFIALQEIFKAGKKISTVFLILSLLLMFSLIYSSNKKPKNKRGSIWVLLPAIILLVTLLSFMSYYSDVIRIFWIFAIIIFVLAFISFGDIGDSAYTISALKDFLFLLIICFFFGKYLYGEIPTSVGGGKPYSIVIDKKFTNLLLDSLPHKFDTLKVLYENESNFLLKDKNGQIYNTQKSEFKSFITLQNYR